MFLKIILITIIRYFILLQKKSHKNRPIELRLKLKEFLIIVKDIEIKDVFMTCHSYIN